MLSAFKTLTNDTIYVATASSVSTTGQITWGTPASRSAYVEAWTRAIRDLQGNEVMTTHMIICEAEVKLSDRIWLEGDDQSNAALARRPLTIRAQNDQFGGVHHYEVEV